MKLIPLEEVIKEISCYIQPGFEREVNRLLSHLPSIDLIEEIDKMQEELKKSPDYMNDKLAGPVREKLLEELKSRLSTNL